MKKYYYIASVFAFCFCVSGMEIGGVMNINRATTVKVVNIVSDNVDTIRRKCFEKDLIMCVGETKVGKSTLCDLLKLNKVGRMEEEEGSDIFELPSELTGNNEDFAGIGRDALSFTKLPGAYELDNAVFLDTKGFFDNAIKTPDEVNFEIAGTILLETALDVARSVKIVCLQEYGRALSRDRIDLLHKV